jgi:hypothetical protein
MDLSTPGRKPLPSRPLPMNLRREPRRCRPLPMHLPTPGRKPRHSRSLTAWLLLALPLFPAGAPAARGEELQPIFPAARLRLPPAALESAVRRVAIDGDTLVVASFDFGVETGSAWVFRRTSSGWRREAVLAPEGPPVAGPQFGASVAISGDTLVVGAPSIFGRAFVFVRRDGAWSQQAVLSAQPTEIPTTFGAQVAASGDRILIGAPSAASSQLTGGAAFAFVRTGDSWQPDGIFVDTADNQYGSVVALAGNLAAIGYFGRVDLFHRNRLGWRLRTRIDGASPGSSGNFRDAALSGSTLAVASAGHAVEVWARRSGAWVREAVIPVEPAFFPSGPVLALDGDTLLVSTTAGAVEVHVRHGSVWTPIALLEPPAAIANPGFGRSVALSGSTAAVASHVPVWIFEGVPQP